VFLNTSYAYHLFYFWDAFLILMSMESSWNVLEAMLKLLAAPLNKILSEICKINLWMGL